MTYHNQRLTETLKKIAAQYLAKEANRFSLITVTDVQTGQNTKQLTILVTVMPEKDEKNALDFLKRQRFEFREFAKKQIKAREIPIIDFAIDDGEKNRQRIDVLSVEQARYKKTRKFAKMAQEFG